MNKWTATGVGPIQASKFNKAWSRAGSAFSTYNYTAHPVMTVHIIDLGAGRSDDEIAALSAVGDKFAWTLTRENIGAATKALVAVYDARMANLPPDTHAPCGCNGAVPHKKFEHAEKYVAKVKEAV